MKANSAASSESLGIPESKVNKKNGDIAAKNSDRTNHGGAAKSQSIGGDAVKVEVTPGLADHLSLDEMADERAKRIAEIRRQVQSGEYFSTRSVTDIAQILERRMGEEIEITKIFTKDEEE
jgi:anti-sigma28 factor (negative regulator of flagellin synthesis)